MDPLLSQQEVPQRSAMRRFLMISLIASLGVSALVAIFVFLAGNFGEIEIRLLLTTLAIGAYSLSGLCSAVLYDRGRYRLFAVLGIIAAFVGFLSAITGIWNILDWQNGLRAFLVFATLSFSAAHASLLLLTRSESAFVNSVLFATLSCIAVVAAMLISLEIGILVSGFDFVSELYYRFLGVFAVLDALGTVVTPILRRGRP